MTFCGECNIFGNEQTLRRLTTAAAEGTLSHAYIFTAPAGGGKSTLAKVAAAACLCLGEGEKPCGKCRSCRMLSSGAHPDLAEIAPSGERIRSIKIDDIRAAREFCAVKPVLSARRAIIIKQAEKMTPQAQSALLKILEEPPAGTHFFILTDNLSGLLPTVRSRAAVIPVLPAPESDMLSLLESRRTAGLSAKDAAAYADGVVGEALSLYTKEGVRAYETAAGLVKTLVGGSLYETLGFREALCKSREEFSAVAEGSLKFCRDLCALKSGVEDGLLYAGRRGELSQTAGKLTKAALLSIIDMLQAAKKAAEFPGADLKLLAHSTLLSCWEEIH